MNAMTKKFMTFKHWKTGEVKTIEFRDADVPANPSSERLVVWNETEQKLEDVIKSTIVEIREEWPEHWLPPQTAQHRMLTANQPQKQNPPQ